MAALGLAQSPGMPAILKGDGEVTQWRGAMRN